MNLESPVDTRLSRPLLDYYRCPEVFVDLRQSGDISEECGYFLVGANITGYGHCALASKAALGASTLLDALPHVRLHESAAYLPFDPIEVIDNLRFERYVEARNQKELMAKAAHHVYYLVRPWLGDSARQCLQRFALRRWQKATFPEWPVDVTVDRLLEKLLTLSMKAHGINKIPFIWFWPNGYSSCAAVTHDVETGTGLDFCPALLGIDDSYGIKASYQLVPEGPYAISDSILQAIRANNCEVNIHDLNHDGNLFRDRAQFLVRADRINQHAVRYAAKGFRSAVLYRNAEWYDAFSQFSYDMSLPNVAHLDPQGGGCCTVMPFFIGNILELPLTTTQDYSLFHILRDYSIELWQRQVSLVMEKHGFISFNVHPDYLIETRARSAYTSLLSYLSRLRKDGRLWIALPRDVDAWWRERSRMQLVYQNRSWQIEGPGNERARIAYASLTGEGISYEIEPPAA